MTRCKLLMSLLAAGVLAGAAGTANAEIVVVVNAKNGNANLTQDQIAALYLGAATAFPDGSAVALADQSVTSESREQFYQKLAGRSASQAKAVWARIVFTGKGQPPKELKDSADVKAFVASDPRAIGYIDAAHADDSVKVVLALK